MMEKIPVIIDTDPGSDDIFAIFLANSSSRLDIRGLSVVAGNMKAELTFENGLAIKEFAGMNTKVAFGAEGPMCIEQRVGSFLHGDRGLGKFDIPKPTGSALKQPSWDFIHDEAVRCRGNLVIIALGPLTNLAAAIIKYPDMESLIKEIVMMGGSADYGNRSAYAEFNIWADPHSARIVFDSGIPVRMLGLNVTNRSAIPFNRMGELYRIKSRISRAVEDVFYYYEEYFRKMNIPGIVIHDAVAVAATIDPSMFCWMKASVKVETQGTLEDGRTLVYHGDEDRVLVGMDIDMDRYVNLCMDMMEYYRKEEEISV